MYQHILTRKESDLIRAMSRDDEYSALDIAGSTKLTPSELSVVIDGLARRGVLKVGGSNEISLTPAGRELRHGAQPDAHNNATRQNRAPSKEGLLKTNRQSIKI